MGPARLSKQVNDDRLDFISQRALSLFKKYGYQQTSVRMVAAACDMTVPGLYYHIRSKEAILSHLVTQDIAIMGKVLETADQEADPLVALTVAMDNWYRHCDRRRDWLIVGYRETANMPEKARAELLASDIGLRTGFEALLDKVIKAKRIQSVDTTMLAHYIVLSGHMWALRGWQLHKQYTLEQYTQGQIEFVRGIALGNRHAGSGRHSAQTPRSLDTA